MSDKFSRAAHWTGQQYGRASVFMVTVGIIIAWAVTGPFFHYSDTWQLIINTGTTIVTFLMVFLLQNTQNRDTAIQLDELIRANQDARNMMLALEDLSEGAQEIKATYNLWQPRPPRLPGHRPSSSKMPLMPSVAPARRISTRRRKNPEPSLRGHS